MAVFKNAKGDVKLNKVQAMEVSATTMAANSFAGAPVLPTYTVATLPPFATNAGKLVYCSNGAAGSPCLAFATSTAWVQVALGSAVADS